MFNDPRLNRLVDDALKENKDLKRAPRQSQRLPRGPAPAGFDLFPTVTAAAGYTKTRESRNQLPAIISPGPDRWMTRMFGFDAFWELDFFGRVRRGIQAPRRGTGQRSEPA